MIVVAAAWQLQDKLAGIVDARGAFLVGKPHDPVGVADIKRVADKRHAERLVQVFKEWLAHLGHAVAIRVAQQSNAVGADPDRAAGNPALAGLGGAARFRVRCRFALPYRSLATSL